ncbi:hypothetical protein HZC32_00970 [Candidatus Woesearchaeota archaeon]|nr:hypothetical protein [Candidatus Woesearchaeota archaeon]
MTAFVTEITIASTLRRVVLSIGDLLKFDLNDDEYYDLSVKLSGIDATLAKANLTIKKLHEATPKKIQTKASTTLSTNQTNVTGIINVSAPPPGNRTLSGEVAKKTSIFREILNWINKHEWKTLWGVGIATLVWLAILILIKIRPKRKKYSFDLVFKRK